MTFFTNPIVSCAKLNIPAPKPKDTWMARNSKQWADLSSKMCAKAGAQTLYVSEIVADLKSAFVYRAAIDFQLCTLVALHAIAARILHLCQETSLLEMAGSTSGRRYDGLQRQHQDA